MFIVHNTNENEKRLVILHLYGMEGIGIYWYLIEWLYQLNGYLTKDDVIAFVSHFKVNYEITIKILLLLTYNFNYNNTIIYYNKAIIDTLENKRASSERLRQRTRKIKELEDEKFKAIPETIREDFKKNYKERLKQQRFIKRYLDNMNGIKKERKYIKNES